MVSLSLLTGLALAGRYLIGERRTFLSEIIEKELSVRRSTTVKTVKLFMLFGMKQSENGLAQVRSVRGHDCSACGQFLCVMSLRNDSEERTTPTL